MSVILNDSKILVLFLWLCAILVNFATSPVHAAIYLILAFIISSLWLFIHGFVLLGYIYVIVYVGAISVLFLFILMLLKVQNNETLGYNLGFWYVAHIIILFIIFYIFFREFLTEIFLNNLVLKNYLWSDITTIYNTNFYNLNLFNVLEFQTLSFDINKLLGFYLYSENGIIVLVFGLLLFISMVLSIFLVKPISYKKFFKF